MTSNGMNPRGPKPDSTCWVLELCECDRFPNCESCGVLSKGIRAATWVTRNWVEIESGALSPKPPRARQ